MQAIRDESDLGGRLLGCPQGRDVIRTILMEPAPAPGCRLGHAPGASRGAWEYCAPSTVRGGLAALSEQVDSGESGEVGCEVREGELLDRINEAKRLPNDQ